MKRIVVRTLLVLVALFVLTARFESQRFELYCGDCRQSERWTTVMLWGWKVWTSYEKRHPADHPFWGRGRAEAPWHWSVFGVYEGWDPCDPLIIPPQYARPTGVTEWSQ